MKRLLTFVLSVALLCPILATAIGATTTAPAQPTLLNDSLVTLLDFEGTTASEQKKDKAPAGKAYDSIATNDTATIADGIANVPYGKNAYLTIKVTEENDLYDLKNKTLIFRAKMTADNGGAAVTAFIDGSGITIQQQNADSNYQLQVKYPVDGSNVTHDVAGTSASLDLCTYALSIADDTSAKTVTFTFYTSANGTDFTLCDTWTQTYTDGTTVLQDTGNWYFGKRSNKLANNNACSFDFEEIRLYDKVLTSAELTSVGSGEADKLYASAKADVQFVAYQTAEHTDTYDIRFIGTVGSTEHTGVGFDIVATYTDGGKHFVKQDSTVYSSLLAVSDEGIAETVSAEDLGGTYLVALTVTGIPKSVGDITFTVRPFTVDAEGNKTYGTEKTIVNPIA